MPYKFQNNQNNQNNQRNQDVTWKDVNKADIPFPPKVPKELLEHVKDRWDIRKNISYEQSVDYLKGVQDVLDYLDYLYLYNYNNDDLEEE